MRPIERRIPHARTNNGRPGHGARGASCRKRSRSRLAETAVNCHHNYVSRIIVRVGDVLAPRQPLGVIGATGRATGAHLHWEIRIAGRAIDPLKFLHAAEVR